MAGPPSYPADPNFSSRPSAPSISSQSNVAFTPSATSVADSSDNEYEPTPIHSPGGPQYDDLPPSYDDARHQAVHDVRHGITPIDPNQIEAHRITQSEGPNQPEVWEYRIRGEQTDPASEQEQAPDYANYTNDKATSVPVQHFSSSESIPVGRMRSEFDSSRTTSELASAMLSRALEFTRHEPDAHAQYAPHLNRIIAIPGEGGSERPAGKHEQFLCAYTQTLHGHSVSSDEFLNFLRGLNVLLRATNTTATNLLQESLDGNSSSGIVYEYIRRANDAFFAPRGLRVSFRNESEILATLPIPSGPGQRAAVATNLLEEPRSAATRAKRLTPWIEPLNTEKLPAPSEHMHRLHEMGERFSGQMPASGTGHFTVSGNTGVRSVDAYDDPPHSIPTASEEAGRGCSQSSGSQGRGNWSPFGAPGNGPFGAPADGPFGRRGRGPFGAAGNGPFGRRGRGRCGASGPSQYGDYSIGKEWAEVGKELGKIGEEFGKMMGDWGMQFGQRANRFGMNVERMTNGSSLQQRGNPGSSYTQSNDDLLPSYEPLAGQETGFVPGDHKIQSDRAPAYMEKGKMKADDDDDASSISSDSSDSDYDSDSDSDDDEDRPDTDAMLAERIRSIDEAATASSTLGQKTPQEISRDRDFAIEKARQGKQLIDAKFAIKQAKRAARRDVKRRSRELKKAHRQRKRELRASLSSPSDGGKGKGKGKSKPKKSKAWKEEKKVYKEKRKVLRKEKLAARKEWRDARMEWRRVRNETRKFRRGGVNGGAETDMVREQDELVWLVIENLGP
ncbi:hypothetical protein DDE82_005537 [Stemphylium lycopersici]|nr:hypothetical protein DDE82_005537 [Stemphylium lycopersici]